MGKFCYAQILNFCQLFGLQPAKIFPWEFVFPLKSSHYTVYWVSDCVKGRFEVELFDVPPLVVDWCLREI